jgi:addiction module HigA family antidote
MMRNALLKGLRPVHPGELLREEVMPALGRSKTEIAALLGISRQTLYDILAERQPITPAMALRFGKLLGNGPELWLTMQRTFDLYVAEQGLKTEVEKIPTLSEAP